MIGPTDLLHPLFSYGLLREDMCKRGFINSLNAELNSICPLLTLFGAHHIFHVSGLRVNNEGENGTNLRPAA
jgi:hypothetical protein